MDYVTSVELFIDLKPRICKVCAYIPQKNLKRTGRTSLKKRGNSAKNRVVGISKKFLSFLSLQNSAEHFHAIFK